MNVSVNIRQVPEGSGLDLMAPVIEKSKGATGVGGRGRLPQGTINTRVVLINLISSVSNNDLFVPVSRAGGRADNTALLLCKQMRCVLSSNSNIFR